jgi:WD40 repeat protein
MSHITSIYSAAFSSDGRKVIFGAQQMHGVQSWDMETPPLLIPLPGGARHRGYVVGALSSNGRWLASAWNGVVYNQSLQPQTVHILDLDTGARVGKPLTGHRGDVHSISSDGRWIISGLLDSTVRMSNVETGTTIGELWRGHFKGPVTSVAISPDDKYIVAGSRDGTICIWDATTRQTVGGLSRCNGTVNSVVFTPDGRRVVSRHSDNTIRVWQTFAQLADETTDIVEAGRYFIFLYIMTQPF